MWLKHILVKMDLYFIYNQSLLLKTWNSSTLYLLMSKFQDKASNLPLYVICTDLFWLGYIKSSTARLPPCTTLGCHSHKNTMKTVSTGAGQHSLPMMPAKSLSIESLCYQDLHTALGENAIDDPVENFLNQPR